MIQQKYSSREHESIMLKVSMLLHPMPCIPLPWHPILCIPLPRRPSGTPLRLLLSRPRRRLARRTIPTRCQGSLRMMNNFLPSRKRDETRNLLSTFYFREDLNEVKK